MFNSWDSAKRLSTNGAQEFVFRKNSPMIIIIYQLSFRPQAAE